METDSYGWVDGERVPLVLDEMAWPEEFEEGDEGTEDAGEPAAGWWPNEGARSLWLSSISRREAGEISAAARRDLVWWLAGDGLHPLRWLRRWTLALYRLAPESLPAEARTVFGAAQGFERAGLVALFGLGTGSRSVMGAGARTTAGDGARIRRERERIEGVMRGLEGKLGEVRGGGAGRTLDDVLHCGFGIGAGPDASGCGLEEEKGEVARLAQVALVRWLAADGGWCLAALKRFYVLIFVRYNTLAPRMTGDDFALIYGQTRAAFSEDAKRYFGLPLESLMGYRPKVAGQKSAESSGAYARNAAEHCPRRQLSGPRFATTQTEKERREMAEDRLMEARASWERRQMEKDAAELEAMARRNRERRAGRGR